MAYRKAKQVYQWIALIPILLTISAIWARSRYREETRLVDHTRAIQQSIYDIQSTLADAETGRRGYILTGDRSYLVPVDAAVSRAPEAVQRLRQLVQDNPVERENVRVLEGLVDDRTKFLQKTTQIGRASAGQVQELERQGGLGVSVQLHDVANRMIADENRLLEARKRASEATDWEVDAWFGAGAIATIVLLMWSYRIVRRYSVERDQADAQSALTNQKLQEEIAQFDRLNRELEERVKARTASLERSNGDLRQFAYVASHDLKEPLRMIVTYTALLEQSSHGKLDADQQKYLSFAVEGAKRMQALIGDLLAYTQAGTQDPEPIPARLDNVLEQARYSLLASIRETGAQITVDPLPELDVDPLKMSLVFQNLLSNAIKFRRPGENPRIHISAELQNAEWRIAVRDEGIGFDPKYADKIFAAFQRLHASGKYPGTGIGLAICKRIVEAHGGRIWAESQADAGATFYFSLPAVDSPLLEAGESGGTALATGR
ncbi:MAG TPA: CHASE3 domain-containing protein [Bryobacteraceae bacterium]